MTYSSNFPERATELEEAALAALESGTPDDAQRAIAFALLAVGARLEMLEYLPS